MFCMRMGLAVLVGINPTLPSSADPTRRLLKIPAVFPRKKQQKEKKNL